MAFPVGLTTATVTVGPILLPGNGAPVEGRTVTLLPEWELIHAPTGTRILAQAATITTNAVGEGSVVVPRSDTPGLTRANPRYLVVWGAAYGAENVPEPFWLYINQDTVDLEQTQPSSGDAGTSVPLATGASAYEMAVEAGFVGTEAQWLASLVGPPGAASTVPGPAGPAATNASALTTGTLPEGRLPARLAADALKAAFLPRWTANTAYAMDDLVLSPTGQVIKANAAFTSGTTYSASNWTVVTGGAAASPITVLTPSGDSTGATDLAAINGALVAGNVVLVGDFVVNAPVEMPSDRTLILQTAEIKLAPFSNCVLLKNKNQDATGNKNVHVVGIGRARLKSVTGSAIAVHADAGVTQLTLVEPIPTGAYRLGDKGSSEAVTVTGCTTTAPYVATLAAPTTAAVETESGIVNQIRGGNDIRNGMGVFFVNVENYTVNDVSIGPTLAFTAVQQLCRSGRWTNTHLAQNRAWANQDGIDIGAGCRDIIIRGVTGTTSDDLFSIYAQNTSPSLHAYVKTLTAADRDIAGIYISDASVDVGINPVRLQAGDGSKLSKVRLADIRNTGGSGVSWPILEFGPTGYVTTAPALGDLTDIVLDGFTGPAKYIIAADTPATNVVVRNVSLRGTWSRLLGYIAANGATPTMSDVVIENVVTDSSTGGGAMMSLAAGTLTNITFRNITLRRATALLANGAAVTGLLLENIRAIVMAGVPFQSTAAETGKATNCRVDTYGAGLQHYTGAACQLTLGGDVPEVVTGDVQPYAARGSQVRAKAGVDLTGGASALGGLYAGDGSAWNRIISLANDSGTAPVSPPSQVTGLTAGTPGATSQPLTWIAATGASTYTVEYKTTAASTWTTASTAVTGTSYTVTGLTAATSYDYRVTAVNSAGPGPVSATVTASTTAPDTTAPSVPTGLTANPGAGQVALSWTASTDNVGVTGYRVYRGGTLVASPTTTSYTNTGLTGGTAYSFTVSAVDAAGNESAQTAAVTATPTSGSAGTVFSSDTFTGTDGTLLTAHAGEVGATWTKQTSTGDFTLAANRAYTASATSALLITSATPPKADYTVEADLVFLTVPASINAGVAARVTNTGGGYALRYIASTGTWRLDKLSGGSGTSIGSAAASVTAGQTKHVGIRCTGSTIVGFVDGVDVVTATDTTFAAAGNAGLMGNGASSTTTGIHVDNYLATAAA